MASPHGSRRKGRGRYVCSACGEAKPEHEFPTKEGNRLRSQCRVCHNRNRTRSPYQREANRRYLLGQYGLTPAAYDTMLCGQNGVCAICEEPEKVEGRSLAVDHDHATGAVRGLLCTYCNTALGKFRDSVELLARAQSYLLESSSSQ